MQEIEILSSSSPARCTHQIDMGMEEAILDGAIAGSFVDPMTSSTPKQSRYKLARAGVVITVTLCSRQLFISRKKKEEMKESPAWHPSDHQDMIDLPLDTEWYLLVKKGCPGLCAPDHATAAYSRSPSHPLLSV